MDLIHLKKSISKMVHTIKGINTIELEKASNQSGFTYYPLGRTSCRNHPSLVFNELYGHNGLCNVIERIYNVTHLVKTIEKNEDLRFSLDLLIFFFINKFLLNSLIVFVKIYGLVTKLLLRIISWNLTV